MGVVDIFCFFLFRDLNIITHCKTVLIHLPDVLLPRVVARSSRCLAIPMSSSIHYLLKEYHTRPYHPLWNPYTWKPPGYIKVPLLDCCKSANYCLPFVYRADDRDNHRSWEGGGVKCDDSKAKYSIV